MREILTVGHVGEEDSPLSNVQLFLGPRTALGNASSSLPLPVE